MLPTYWVQFIESNQLAGQTVCLGEDDDLSKIGVDMQFLSEEQSAEELNTLWPGIRVGRDGYVPVGGCLIGSGDQYFLNVNDGPNGPLYRIYHDAVYEEGYDVEHAVAKVLGDFKLLLGYVER
jgi:hypothetical protein